MLACPRCGSTYLREVVHCGLDGERLITSDRDLLLGRTVDRYAIEGVLGDGGMARVYRARHVHLAQPFALKVLFGDMATDRALAERFRREGQSAAQIKHPNVVAVTDFGVSPEGLSFMAMELLEGPTLAEVARQGKPLSPARVAAIVRQVADGLGAAHALGFVHRDLKPKNVMVVSDSGAQRVKILDFGLVRPLENGTDARLTQQGQIFGTPAYMAPEQIIEGEVDARTDLYALGAMLYELLSGKPPFLGSMAEIFKKHLYEAPAPLADRSGLGELALVLLSKERGARPKNTREVIEIIDGLGLGLETDGVLVSMPPALTEGARSTPRGAEARPAEARPAEAQPAPRSAEAPRGSRTPLDVTAASPAASAMSIDPSDSLGIAIGEPREIDDRQIEQMAAGARPSLLLPLVVIAAAAGAGWLGYRAYHRADAGAQAAPMIVDAGEALDAAVAVVSSPPDAGSAAPSPRPRSPSKGASAAAAAAAAAGAGALSPGAAAAATAVAVVAPAVEDDVLPPIPSRDAGPSGDESVDAAVTASAARPTTTPRPTATPAPTASPEVVGAFEALDRELKRVLLERDLHLLDLEPQAPSAVQQWRTWRMRPDGSEPPTAARDEAFAALRDAAALAALDQRQLMELKIARLQRRVDELGKAEVTAELEALMSTAAGANNSAARARVLSQLTAFELRVDRLRGEE